MRKVPKFFNTAGPIQPDIHYNVEPLSRIDLEEVEQLIYQRKYFVLHAPRQTGKTSCLLALRDYLNARGGVRPSNCFVQFVNRVNLQAVC